MTGTPPFPLPDPSWEPTRGFWEAAARSELAIPRCLGCRAWIWYPRNSCACGGAWQWSPVSGRGTLFSWAVVRRPLVAHYASLVPYTPALVCLHEDPRVRLVTRIVDCPPEALRMELAVRVVFRELHFGGVDGIDGEKRPILAPCFTPES